MDPLTNQADAESYLKAQGLATKEAVVRKVVHMLSRIDRGERGVSLRSLWNPNSASRICGKGTADKIRKLVAAGTLEPYLQYIQQPESLGQNQLPAPATTTPSGAVNQKDEAELRSNEDTAHVSPHANPPIRTQVYTQAYLEKQMRNIQKPRLLLPPRRG